MNRPQIKLSPRFKIFVDKILPNVPFWDLCCDHGYVGLEIFFNKKSSEVHLVDQVPHIMQKIAKYLQDNLEDTSGIELHIESAQNLKVPLTGTVLIAGVGGKTIQIIVQELLKTKLLHATRLLLSPHTDLKAFNELIQTQEFQTLYTLTEKVPLDEGGIIKTLFVFDQSSLLR